MSGARPQSAFHQRFPALRAVSRWRHDRVPVILQTSAADCGAACLAMVLLHHGHVIDPDSVRGHLDTGGRGCDAAHLLGTARLFGLRGRGLQIDEVDDLRLLAPGSILHWRFNHFVVFERLGRSAIELVDPALGRRRVDRREIDRSLTGVALVFEPIGTGALPGLAPAPAPGESRAVSRDTRRDPSRRRERNLLAQVLVASLLLQGLALLAPLAVGIVVEDVVPHGDPSLLELLVVGTVGLAAFRLLAALLRSALITELRARVDSRLTLEFVDHLLHQPLAFFAGRSVADLMMRLESNAVVREILTASAASALLDGTTATAALVVLTLAQQGLGALAAALGGLRLLVVLASRQRRRDHLTASIAAQSASRSAQFEILTGLESLKAAGGELDALERWSRLYVSELNAASARAAADGATTALLESLALASPLLILLAGAHLVLQGDTSLGGMLALAALATSFLNPLGNLVQTLTQLELLSTLKPRIQDVLQRPRERAGGLRPQRLRGEIRLCEVGFRYAPGSPTVLDSISFTVRPGQLVAIVGRSGSGKSTLAQILAGLRAPSRGRILFDGADVEELDIQWLRRHIGFVPQSPVLFRRSVHANIALYEPDMPRARVVEAARAAAIHEDILDLPMRYETLLGEGGASLSGGQRQRLVLARALAHRPRLLVLDESTSHLDSVNESRVANALQALRNTRIVIAHRWSSFRRADRIVVLERGRIVGMGTHDELWRGVDLYRGLVQEQMEGRQSAAES